LLTLWPTQHWPLIWGLVSFPVRAPFRIGGQSSVGNRRVHAGSADWGGSFLVAFQHPAGEFIAQNRLCSDTTLAIFVGAVILIMTVTNTEHPPAAATVLGMAIQPLDPLRIAVFIAAIILLAAIHFLFKSRLRDLI
jgi:hypothetical protein